MTSVRLCYVDEPWAYFTPRLLSEQSGDDWNDAPYEHNAEPPHEDDIVRVAYSGDFQTPSANCTNSSWCVDDINKGGIAWLRSPDWKTDPRVFIPAGTALDEFIELIRLGGGKVYAEARFEKAKGLR
jgi:hypothetical protein